MPEDAVSIPGRKLGPSESCYRNEMRLLVKCLRCNDIIILEPREPYFQSIVLNKIPQILKLYNVINLTLRKRKHGLIRKYSNLPIYLVNGRTKVISFRGCKLYIIFNKLLSA